MPRNKADAGLWYYHAPADTAAGMPKINYPPASQIPGLNGVPVTAEDQAAEDANSKFWFKDTDTAYVRLAKMGGRKDLLMVRDQNPTSGNQAAPARYDQRHNRCDWFYQLDNLAADAKQTANEPKQEYRFQVPEYMVHHERKPRPPPNYLSNAPFATHAKNVTDSIDFSPTDKTRRIKEPLKEGCGRRLAKKQEADHRSKHSYYPQEYDREATRSAPQSQMLPRYELSRPPPIEPEGNDMSKLLSYGYQRDWVDEQKQWWNVNEKRAVQFAEQHGLDAAVPPQTIIAGYPGSGPGVSGSEYNQQYAQYAPTQTRHAEAYANAGR